MGDSLKAAKELKARMLSVWQTVKGLRKEYSHPAIKNKAAFGVQVTPEEDRTARWADNLRNRGPLLSKRNAYDLLARPIGWGMQQGATIGLAALSKVKSALVSVGRYAGFAAMAGLGISLYQLEQHTVNVAHNAVAYDAFAVSVGSSTLATMELISAFKLLGIESEIAIRGITAVQDTLLAASFKDRVAIATLRDIGIGDIVTRPVTQGVGNFYQVSDAIMKVEDDLTRLSLAYRIFGDDAAKILKLSLVDKLDPTGAHKGMAAAFSPKAIGDYYSAQTTALMLSARMETVMAKMLTAASPVILKILDALEFAMSAFNAKGDNAGLNAVASWIGYAVDLIAKLPTVVEYVLQSIRSAVADTKAMLTDLRYMFESLYNMVTDRDASQKARDMIGTNPAVQDARRIQDEVNRLRDSLGKPGTLHEWLREGVAGLNIKPLQDYYNRMLGLLRLYTPLMSKAKEYNKASTHPFEAFKTNLRELDVMRATTMVDPVSFGRTFMRLVGDAERNMNAIDIRLPSAASRDSVEARSAVVRSEVEYNLTNANTPIARMQRVIEIGNGLLSIIENNTRRTAEEIKNNPDLIRLPQ